MGRLGSTGVECRTQLDHDTWRIRFAPAPSTVGRAPQMQWAYVTFWMFCAVAVACWSAPKIIRARAEAKCSHSWELVSEGPLKAEMGTPDERVVGTYQQYRCTVCGAERQYD